LITHDNSGWRRYGYSIVVHNAEMKTIVYCCLGIVFVTCVGLGAFLLHGPKEKETWSTLAAVLAVIAAVIAVLPALRVLEIQEDSQHRRPTPYFDLTSRYNLLQLRVKNFGTSVAYDVHLKWKTCPVDHKGDEVRSLDRIAVLVPQDSVSTLIGTSHDTVRKLSNTQFSGKCHYKDASGKRFRQKFICSVDANQKQLLHDNELPKTLREIQDIPKELARIADQLEKANASILEATKNTVDDNQ
jgi:hypothetical protein